MTEKRSDAISLLLAVAHLAFVLLPIYLAAALGPGPLLVLLWLWFGCFVHGLLNLMHECAHWNAFERRWLSDWLGRFVLGPLAFADFDAYRARHWDHHRFLGASGDTKDAYEISIAGGGLARLAGRCLLGREALRIFAKQKQGRSGSAGWILRLVVFQVIYFGSLVATARAAHGSQADSASALFVALVAYASYALGLATLTPLVSSLRTIAEHQPGGDGAPAEGRAALRNLSSNSFSRLLMGAHGFADHATHHAQPGVPAYRLPQATARLSQDDPTFSRRAGYLATLAMLRSSGRGGIVSGPSSARARRSRTA